jgi:TM2 domain-containing membrane protein YozV
MSEEKQNTKHVPEDEKVVAGVLALLFGGLGLHKFYLGRMKQGIVFLLLF